LVRETARAFSLWRRALTRPDTISTASELSRQLRAVADEYLAHANRDRPEHLEAILAPSIVPAD